MQLVEFAFLSVVALITIEPSKSDDRNCGKRVTNEENIVDGIWPWLGAVYQSDGDGGLTFKCAGTLIHPSLVLTSGRCVFAMDQQISADRLEVHLGKVNLDDTSSNVQIFQVEEVIVHTDFNPTNFANNLAMIRLSKVANVSDLVQPVCMWNSNRTATPEAMDELGTVVGWGIIKLPIDTIPETAQHAFMTITRKVNCLNGRLSLPDGSFCADYQYGTKSGKVDSGTSMVFIENGVYKLRGIMSEAVQGHNNAEHAIFTDIVKFIPWIEGDQPADVYTQDPVCRPNEEFVRDPYRCDETCEEYGNPICIEYSPEAKCYCKKGFVRLKAFGICVTADNRACRANMPPTEETCARKSNEHLSEFLYDEPCANSCQNYNTPCNVSVPRIRPWGPHCVCNEGFSRLPNQKCVPVDDPNCKNFWNPACTDFCGRSLGSEHVCSQFDLGMQWSSAREILGRHCTHIVEVADPHTWSDNYLCFNEEYGVRWSSAGSIEGMECTQILEVADPHTWYDNYLCVPRGSPFRFRWSSNGPITGLCCILMNEPAEPPAHTWHDNYLCVSK